MSKNKYDDFSSAYGGDQLYDFDNNIILEWYAKKIIDKFSKDIAVLDLGLGHGITANIFSKHFIDYTIIEGSKEIIKKYKLEFSDNTTNIINSYFENYNTDKRYDLIIIGFILEHVENPVELLMKYKTLLKNDGGGGMILAVPNAEAMNRRLGLLAGFLKNITELSDYDRELGHLRYYTIDTFMKDIEKSGLRVNKLEGIYIKPFTTKQIASLNFDKKVIDALCYLGVEYPELSLGILAECEI